MFASGALLFNAMLDETIGSELIEKGTLQGSCFPFLTLVNFPSSRVRSRVRSIRVSLSLLKVKVAVFVFVFDRHEAHGQ